MGEKRNTVYRGFVGKREDERARGTSGDRWKKNNIKVDLKEMHDFLDAARDQ